MPRFTDQQKLALTLPCNLSVRANAGSGKTTVLAHRVVLLLALGKATIQEIVCITFTTKAAAEMRRRIYDLIEEVLTGSVELEGVTSTSAATVASRLRKAQSELGMSNICTFHSFCSNIIRDYSFELDLPADIRDMDEREADGLRFDAIRNVVSRRLSVDSDYMNDFLGLYDCFDIDSLQKLLRTLIASRESVSRFNPILAISTESELREFASDRFITGVVAILQNARTGLSHILAEMTRNINLVDEEMKTLVNGLSSFVNRQNEDAVKDFANLARCLSSLRALYTKSGTFTKRSNPWPKQIPLPDISVDLLALAGLDVEVLRNEEVHQATLLYTLGQVVNECSNEYRALKLERNGMDFDDMMWYAIELFQNKQAAGRLQRSVGFLMIDEYQDTNPTQQHFVQLLTDASSVSNADINLFVVGDAKQGIYGFRDADIRIFRQTETVIGEMNARKNHQHHGVILLPHSFRMAPNLVDKLNAFFSYVFTGDSEFEVDYEPLECGRITEFHNELGSFGILNLEKTSGEETESDSASDEGDDAQEATEVEVEMQNIAQMIPSLLASDSAYRVETKTIDGTQLRPPRLGDIAILVRDRKGVAAAVTALKDAGIPCEAGGSRDFFARPEVADIRNLLSWCSDTSNNLALLSMLRSPLFALPDAQLLELVSFAGKETNVWLALSMSKPQSPLPESIRGVFEQLKVILLLQKSLPVVQFIKYVLLNSKWYAVHNALADTKRVQANVQKLLEIIRLHCERHGYALPDVLQAISIPAFSDNETEQQFELSEDVVRVMTIHASKGLEFPIVIMANLNKLGGTSGALNYSERVGYTITLPKKRFHVGSEEFVSEVMPTFTSKLNAEIQNNMELAETRRVLYVGATRAKDHLIMVRSLRRNKGGEFSARVKGIGGILNSIPQHVLEEYALRTFPSSDGPVHTEMASSGVLDLSAVLSAGSQLMEISVSKLVEIISSQRGDEAYILRSEADKYHGQMVGSLTHAVVEAHISSGIFTWLDVSSSMLQQALDVANVASLEIRDQVKRNVVRVLDTLAPYQSQLEASKLSVEHEVMFPFGETVVRGIPDLYYELENSVMLWDWKSNAFGTDKDIEELSKHYEIQLRIYAWMLFPRFAHINEIHAHLVFTNAPSVALGLRTVTIHRTDLPAIEMEIANAIGTRQVPGRCRVPAGYLR